MICSQFFALTDCYCQNSITDRSNYIKENLLVNENNIPLDTSLLYFPLELFPRFSYTNDSIDSTATAAWMSIEGSDTSIMYSQIRPNEFDTFRIKWYSKHLYALNEPLLYNKLTTKETYRFTWLRTFHNPVVIRIEKSNNNYMLYWKVCNGAGGYSPGKLKKNKQKKISLDDWNGFNNLLDSIDYWNIKKTGALIFCDGARWILEGSTRDKYYVIDIQSPNEANAYYKVCDYLIQLTGLKIKEKY